MNLLSPIGILLIGLFYIYKKGSCMQKIVFSLLVCCSLSLPAMQTEQERHESTCKEWGKYLIRAAESIQVDAAMVHQIAANMQREKCQNKVKGRLARQHVSIFTQAHARISCPDSRLPMGAFPVSLTSPEPADPFDTCHFKFKNQ